mmetsp:Transcript_6002/g.17132  ORF Transcript_6002/g.17132 Transcript_6002/m.17132 type:complete len:247 (-) Transcript_6002:109-849(-)
MTGGADNTFSICLHVGSATSSDAAAFSKIMTASNAADVAAARQNVAPSSVDALLLVVSAADLAKADVFNPMELANWVSVLNSEASVAIQVVGECQDLQPVHTSFLLAGLASASERRTADGSRILTAKRKPAASAAAMPLKKVTVALEDEDMINEDDLLEDDVLAPPPAMGARTAGDDCDGRKPCDNCTCGRADEQDGPKKMENAPSSSCGKCHLGDAFRCASCPYLGKPAFKTGEEHLVLELADDF